MADNNPNKTAKELVASWSSPVLENVLAANIINILQFLHHYMNI